MQTAEQQVEGRVTMTIAIRMEPVQPFEEGRWQITMSCPGEPDQVRTFDTKAEAQSAMNRTLQAAKDLEVKGQVLGFDLTTTVRSTPREAS